jgi:hypothetical protein
VDIAWYFYNANQHFDPPISTTRTAATYSQSSVTKVFEVIDIRPVVTRRNVKAELINIIKSTGFWNKANPR